MPYCSLITRPPAPGEEGRPEFDGRIPEFVEDLEEELKEAAEYGQDLNYDEGAACLALTDEVVRTLPPEWLQHIAHSSRYPQAVQERLAQAEEDRLAEAEQKRLFQIDERQAAAELAEQIPLWPWQEEQKAFLGALVEPPPEQPEYVRCTAERVRDLRRLHGMSPEQVQQQSDDVRAFLARKHRPLDWDQELLDFLVPRGWMYEVFPDTEDLEPQILAARRKIHEELLDEEEDDQDLEPEVAGEPPEPEPPARYLRPWRWTDVELEPPPPPELIGLLYVNRQNWLFGEPEAGKSWIALRAAIDVLEGGGRVVWICSEDTFQTFKQRLKALGGSELAERTDALVWVDLDTWMEGEPVERREEHAQLFRWAAAGDGPGHVFIDAAGSSGCGEDKESLEEWAQHFLPPVSEKLGCTVLDHVPKQRKDRPPGPVGSHQKLARVKGSGLFVCGRIWTPKDPGEIKVIIHKDRPGGLRTEAAGDLAAVVHGIPDPENGTLRLEVVKPDAHAAPPGGDLEPARQEVLRVLRDHPEGATKTTIRKEAKGFGRPKTDRAVEDLVSQAQVAIGYEKGHKIYVLRKEDLFADDEGGEDPAT